ncbi:TRAP transporter small permease [Amphritea sp. HPY]|uniref:TRAP transporter small permease n=1 Tax=Amphritea sp. HPY TaxID=3421652 RepID=UPI003D7E2069
MHSINSSVFRLQDLITKVGFYGGVLGLCVITSSYVFEVVARYMFDSPTTWANDLVSYLLCISVFLALPEVTRSRGHIAVTILVDIAPKKMTVLLQTLINLFGFIACVITAWICADETYRQMIKGITTLANDPIPQWWISIFIAYGLLWSSLYFLRYMFSHSEQENGELSLDKVG